MLDKNIVLPSEIELSEIEKGDAYDIWGENNLFGFDEIEARAERRHVDRVINELRGCGGWIER